MRTPAGDIPATGKPVDIPFVGLMTVENGKMASFRVYFDTGDLMRQLGIASA
jgi:predicted ester cyclase